jgi:SSS family solute:Na+ symporter
MAFLDWLIVFSLMALLTISAWSTKKHTKSVADFLAANRCAGRYVICVASGIVGLGAITFIANFQMFYKVGFTGQWWRMIEMPIGIIIAVTGWVVYRFRETRAFTLAQFFEMRYSRNFRVFVGILGFTAGIVNFGIFPAVGAKFFISFAQLPLELNLLGLTLGTFPVIMFILLAISLLFTFLGGQIAVIITDFLQGMFCNIVFIIVLIFLFTKFNWQTVVEGLSFAPENKSMLNPMATSGVPDFNIWFFLIAAFTAFYGCRAWQGGSGYNCSAKNPHEAKMAVVLGRWRAIAMLLLLLMLPIYAYVVMKHPSYSHIAENVQTQLDSVTDHQARSQMLVPTVLSKIIPKGLLGAFCAVVLAALISTHDTYLHSWGSILIQDVILPFRKKPFSPEAHMKLLRLAIVAVAIFVFIFSLLFVQKMDIFMYFAITGSIFVGGVGSAIIGGLYWKRGSTQAAWSAMIVGSVLSVSGILVKQFNPDFPINGQVMSFIAMASSIIVYVLVSLLGPKTEFNMDKLLHRGKYKVVDDQTKEPVKPQRGFKALITPEFTLTDKLIYLTIISWAIGWFLVCVFGSLYAKIVEISDESWSKFWHFYVWLSLIIGIITTVWFTIGGIRDLKDMFRTLKTIKRNILDDGTVVDDHNLGEKYVELNPQQSGDK